MDDMRSFNGNGSPDSVDFSGNKAYNESKEGAVKKRTSSSTPYDDSFRTLLTDCPRMIIPVINEMFGESHDISEDVTLYQNEHYTVSDKVEKE